MKTLFLDFDGVLHPNLPGPNQRFALAAPLAEVLHGTACDIVISSSWRFQLALSELKKALPAGLAQRIVGTTGDAVVGRYARYREILAWIQVHGYRDWRALDDSAFEFPKPCPELICCNGALGVTEQELSRLATWLRS